MCIYTYYDFKLSANCDQVNIILTLCCLHSAVRNHPAMNLTRQNKSGFSTISFRRPGGYPPSFLFFPSVFNQKIIIKVKKGSLVGFSPFTFPGPEAPCLMASLKKNNSPVHIIY